MFIYGVQREPYLPEPYTFEFKNSYAYQYIPSIDQAINPIDFHSNNNFCFSSLSGAFNEGQAIFFELGANATSLSSFNFFQATVQYRFALLNELIGDPLTLQIAPVFSFIPNYRIKDVNTDYQNTVNVSTICSFGREIEYKNDWVAKFYGVVEGGISSGLGPFFDIEFAALAKLSELYILKLSFLEFIGFGRKNVVNVSNFNGWSEISHQSLQIQASFSFILGFYGNLDFSYGYRIYSKSYFQNDSTFQVSYTFPFSP